MSFGFTWHAPTLVYGLLYGAVMTSSMYTGYKALTLGPMALTSMLTAFSVIIPLIYGVIFREEKLDVFKYAAFVLLIFAIIFTNIDKIFKKEKSDFKRGLWLLYIGITFLTNGIASILQKEHQLAYPEQYSREFMFFAMLLASVAFNLVFFIKKRRSDIKHVNGKRFGALSNNLGRNDISVMLCGRFVFREKLKLNHYTAIILGIVAVVLLKI